jgi:hypothetical protein
MITALISTVLGIAGGAVPKIFEMVQESKDRTHELAIMDKQLAMQSAGHDQKLEEIREGAVIEELRAWRDQIKGIYDSQGKALEGTSGWLRDFNALIRPATAALVIILFIVSAAAYVWGVLMDPDVVMTVKVTLIWGSLVGEAIQAVLGYLFGYRTTKKMMDR